MFYLGCKINKLICRLEVDKCSDLEYKINQLICRLEVDKCSDLEYKIKKLIDKKENKDEKVAENRRHSLNRTDELENKVQQ